MSAPEKSPRSSLLSSRLSKQHEPEHYERSPQPAGNIGANDPAVTAQPDKSVDVFASTPPTLRRWMIFRSNMRAYVAEFIGTAVLVIFGTASNCQVILSTNPSVSSTPQGSYLSLAFGWGVGIAIGIWLSAGISGGHINPAVTLAMATWRRFPWKKVPGYILAQILGGLVGAAVVYGNYYQAINVYEGGGNLRTEATRGLFATYALPYVSNAGAFFDEALGTFFLVITILAVSDRKNSPPPAGLLPLVIFLVFTGISIAFGMQTGFAINPARDLGPRLMTVMAGWGREVFTYRNHYWIWCPIIAPIIGAQLAAFLYDAFLYTGRDSPAAKLYVPHSERVKRGQDVHRKPMPTSGPGAAEAV